MSADVVASIRAETLDRLAPCVPAGRSVAMLDFPMHKNAGDSFIYLGQRAYLQTLGASVGYISDIYRLDPAVLRRRTDGPILIQGGGNFGDVWPEIQQFREDVVNEFPDRPVVQMPQSLHYGDEGRAATARAAFEKHGDVLLFLRDQRSLASARRLFPNTPSALCPDMAFGMDVDAGATGAVCDVVQLLRHDRESQALDRLDLAPGTRSEIVDWDLRPLDRVLWKALRRPGQIMRHIPGGGAGLYPAVHGTYNPIAQLHLRAATALLKRGRVVASNRLHAVILGALLGLPAVALDNSYGKLRAVYDTTLSAMPEVSFAASLEEAVELVDKTVAETRR